MSRLLYLDAFSGISGDMTVAMLIDLGVSLEVIQSALATIDLKGYSLAAQREMDGAISGMTFRVRMDPPDHNLVHPADQVQNVHAAPRKTDDHHAHHAGHGHRHAADHADHADQAHAHGHPHPHHPEEQHKHTHPHHTNERHRHEHGHAHRRFKDIRALIETSGLAERVKQTTLNMFEHLATAEGKIHHQDPDEVSFHEVGAVDSIVDMVAVAVGLEHLGVDRVEVSPLPLGHGRIDCQHGRMPLPAPATLELLKGFTVYDGGQDRELVTPTGAAIVAALAQRSASMPTMRIAEIGWGLGETRGGPIPNALRGILGTRVDDAPSPAALDSPEDITVIETNIDDMSPQLHGHLIDRLLAAGALDVTLIPAFMKKGRGGLLIQALTRAECLDPVAEVLFQEATTIGIRYQKWHRKCLKRSTLHVRNELGTFRVKVALSPENTVVNVMPEYDDCAEAAQRLEIPLKAVHLGVLQACPRIGERVETEEDEDRREEK